MAILLCERFLSKTRDVADAIPVQNYFCHALAGDQPLLFEGLASVSFRNRHHADLLCVVVSAAWFTSNRTISVVYLHLCYPNSADALALESSTLKIRQSHGVLQTVISRVCYDEKLK